jgi:hypothetical protein
MDSATGSIYFGDQWVERDDVMIRNKLSVLTSFEVCLEMTIE